MSANPPMSFNPTGWKLAMCIGLMSLGIIAGSHATAQSEYDELLRIMGQRSNWNNERLARETFRSEALILESDRTPVDIVWRRTNALLKYLKSADSAPNLKVEENALESLRSEVESSRMESGASQEPLRTLFDRVSDFLMLPELLASFDRLGYDVVEMVLADQDGWDR